MEKKSLGRVVKEKKLKLGIFSYSYHLAFGKHPDFTAANPDDRMDLFKFMDRSKELGVDGIQIDITHLESTDDVYLEKLSKYAQNKGFYVEYGSILIEDGHTLKELEIARQLKAPIMRTFMGFSRYDKTCNPKHELENAIAVLKNLLPKLHEYDIKLAIENHCDCTTDELLSVIHAVNDPYVGVCPDLGNFMINLENPTKSVKKLAPYIITTHFKDYNMEMCNWGFKSYGVALGDGMIDLKAILKILVKDAKLDRIMLEIPVEKASFPNGLVDDKTSLAREDDFMRRSVIYARDVLKIK
jgi:sugar phosphate isomerase/epimerase